MKNESFFHCGQAVPLDISNVDTDQIIPKQFLKSIKKTGFGPFLFDAWRFNDEGHLDKSSSSREINNTFPLNKRKYLNSSILLSKENFQPPHFGMRYSNTIQLPLFILENFAGI